MTKGIDLHTDKEMPPGQKDSGGCRQLSQLFAGSKEAGVAELAHLFDHLFDLLDEPIAVIDAQGQIIGGNRGWSALEALFLRQGAPKGCLRYAEFCAKFAEPSTSGAAALAAEMAAVQKGGQPEYRYDLVLMEGERRRNYTARVIAIPAGKEFYAVAIHYDESHRQKLEADHRESHNLFHQVMESISNGVFLYDVEGRFVMVNSVFADALGIAGRDLIGRSIFEVFKPEMAQTIQEQNLLVLTTGQTLSFELVLETTRGLRNIHLSKSAYRNHRNQAFGILGVAQDITDRKHVIEALENSERHFRALIENGGDRVGLLDGTGTIKYASPSTKRILGYEIEELLGTDAFLWVHPQDRPSARGLFAELLTKPDLVVSAQYRVLHKGGEWKWMEATAANRLHDPAIGAVVLNERDITERKKAEADLVGFSQIIESSNDAILATDLEGNITSWNPSAVRTFGYTEKEIIGQPASILVVASGRRQHQQLRQAALRGEGVADYELQMLHKSGRRVSVALSISPLRNEQRIITGSAKIIRDITERRRMEREILEISDREKHRLGQDLHDDLCQHLVGISLISNMLAEQLEKAEIPQSGEARNIADLTRHAVDHARSLARGLSPLKLEDHGLIPQMGILVSVTERLFRVPCTFESDLELEVRNLDNATHFYRIMQEALHNAVKHSQATQVDVRITAEGNNLLISVADNGVGMGNAVTGGCGGETPTGLGMHTMQYRARILGGTLEVRENPGGGTLITCLVPRRKLGC